MCMLHFWQVHIMVTQHASLNSLQEGSVCSMYHVFTVGLQGDNSAAPAPVSLATPLHLWNLCCNSTQPCHGYTTCIARLVASNSWIPVATKSYPIRSVIAPVHSVAVHGDWWSLITPHWECQKSFSIATTTPTGHLAVAQNFTSPSQHTTMMQRHALVSLLLCAVIALFQVSSALSQSMSSYAGKYNLQFAAQNSVVQSIPPGRTISLSVEQLPDDSNMYRLSIKVANILMSSFKIISTNENGEETIKCGPGKLCFIFCFRFSVFYEFSSIPCST